MPVPKQSAPVRYAAIRKAHLDCVRRALKKHTGRIAVSHESAAIVQGLATYDIPATAYLTRTDGSRRNGRRAKVAVAELPACDVQFIDGIWVTSLARTVIDIARTRPFIEALVAADAALRAGVTRAELEQLLLRMRKWPGTVAAAKVVRWADRRAQSPLESVIRARCILLNLPIPELQWRVECPSGREAWADFYWVQWGLVGEADGRTKYDGPDGTSSSGARSSGVTTSRRCAWSSDGAGRRRTCRTNSSGQDCSLPWTGQRDTWQPSMGTPCANEGSADPKTAGFAHGVGGRAP